MSVAFREARREDVPTVVALLKDDVLGAGREDEEVQTYHSAFEAMRAEGNNLLIVGEKDGQIVATYQITFISGLSLRASRRANIESVRVAETLRGERIGAALIADAEARARAAGCALMQLTMNAVRHDARRFYEQQGFLPSHVGFKRVLK
ncbi:MAG: GNAT family N-acetyltransferase [Rhodobacter sp.]|nr:GNAT family N-acetyltransferase [Rhodobacter sp.]